MRKNQESVLFFAFFKAVTNGKKQAAVKKYLKRENIFIKSLTNRTSGVTINIPVWGILSDINQEVYRTVGECTCCKKKAVPRTEKEKSALIGRLNRISGQINGVSKMIENDRYCDDVLIQLAAVYKSIKSVSAVILEEHMKSCVVESVKRGETEAIDEIIDLFRKFV